MCIHSHGEKWLQICDIHFISPALWINTSILVLSVGFVLSHIYRQYHFPCKFLLVNEFHNTSTVKDCSDETDRLAARVTFTGFPRNWPIVVIFLACHESDVNIWNSYRFLHINALNICAILLKVVLKYSIWKENKRFVIANSPKFVFMGQFQNIVFESATSLHLR